MRFNNPESTITQQRLEDIEARLGVKLPAPVKTLYLSTNGGEPEPYVFEVGGFDTVVSDFLPLSSADEDRCTVTETYEHLVLKKRLVPQHFVPFAVEGGGDFFFVDCSTPEGAVHYYVSDSVKPGLRNLGLGFSEFWSSLKEEGNTQ